MKNQVLSIEQMKHLKELGVDTSNASMEISMFKNGYYSDDENDYEVHFTDDEPIFKLDISGSWEIGSDASDCSTYECVEVTPAFTLQDMLALMPKEILLNSYYQGHLLSHLIIDVTDGIVCYEYIVQDEPKRHIEHEDKNLLIAAYEMLCWLAEKRTSKTTTMTPQQILHNLHLYQKWRRGGKMPQPNPKEVGETLDEVIRLLRKIKKGEKI